MIQDEEDVVKTATLLDLSNNSSDSEGNDSSEDEEDSSLGEDQGILGRGRRLTKGSISSTGAFFEETNNLKEKPTRQETLQDKRMTISSSSAEKNIRSSSKNADSIDRKTQDATFTNNPLTSVMTNSELQDFVTQTLSPSQVFQCSIMRDKRGIDRSLYPTYFMYLQSVVNADGKIEQNTSQVEADDDKTQDSASSLSDKKLVTKVATSSGARQAFLLCGRRRKKSKTYLIGMDPFDISRCNSIAKLKSNIIGTEFRSLRLVLQHTLVKRP
jgi:hypothetical protein